MTLKKIYQQTLFDFIYGLREEEKSGIMYIDGVDQERFVSYAQLFENAAACLGGLQKKGLVKNDELVIQLDDNEALLTTFWACILGGIIPVPLSVGRKEIGIKKLYKIWNYLSNPYLISSSAHLQNLAAFSDGAINIKEQLDLRSLDFDQLEKSVGAALLTTPQPEDLAFIQFSSGSTGVPKGVMLSHRNLAYNVYDCMVGAEITAATRGVSWIPLTHDLGMIAFHISHVAARANQYIMPTSLFVRRPLLWLLKASEYKATILYSPNFGIKYYLDAFKESQASTLDLSSIQAIINGAEPISARLCRQFTTRLSKYGLSENCIQPSYGMAEATVGLSSGKIGAPLKEYFLNRECLQIGKEIEFVEDTALHQSIGFVDLGEKFEHTEIRVCDDAGNILSPNKIGHIQIQGPNVTQGYYNNPEATQDTFTADGWLKTGDVGFFTEEDTVVITGRFKNIIILNGQNYYAHDIEEVLQEVEGIDLGKIAVCGIAGNSGQAEKLVLFWVTKKGMPEVLLKYDEVNAKLAGVYGIQAAYLIPLRGLPKTTSGKVQHFSLIDQFLSGKFQDFITAFEAARIEKKSPSLEYSLEGINQRINKLISSIGQLDAASLHLNIRFSDIVIDSLVFIRIIQAIQNEFGVAIEVEKLYTKQMNIGELGQYIFENIGEEKSRLSPRRAPEDPMIESFVRASSNQKALWYVNKFSPQIENNIGFCIEVNGQFDAKAWKNTVIHILNRHESLRSCFTERNGEPFIEITKQVESIPFLFDKTKSIDDAEELLLLHFNRPFDMEEAPIFRLICVQLSESRHLLGFCFHHIITDGWSLQLFYDELKKSLKNEKLPELALNYSTFVKQEERERKSTEFKEATAYYRVFFEGDLTRAKFISPALDAPKTEERANCIPFSLDKELIISLCEKLKMSPFLLLLALYHLLLARYNGQKKVITASPVARRSSKWMNTIGYFSNLQYLKTEYAAGQTFRDYVNDLKSQFYQTYQWQKIPYSSIIEQVFTSAQKEKKELINQFFFAYQSLKATEGRDSLFSMKEAPLLETEQFVLNNFPIDQQTNVFDLALEVIEDGDQISACLKHKNAEAEKVALYLVDNYKYLIQLFFDNTDTPIESLVLVDEEQQNDILDFSHTDSNVKETSFSTIIDAFEYRAAQDPLSIALNCEGKEITYQQLNEQANQLANYLKETYQVEAEDRIAILLPTGNELILSMLAILKTGATYVPVDTNYPKERIELIMEESTPGMILDEAAMSVFQANAADYSRENLKEDIGSEQLAYILFTSGTTGRPKGVMIEHAALLDYASTTADYFEITEKDVVLQQSSPSFDTLVEELFPALIVGAKVVIIPEGGKDLRAIRKSIKEEGVSIISSTPLVINELNKVLFQTHNLRVIISGGDVLKLEDVDQLMSKNLDIYNTYGPTESTVCASYQKIEAPDDIKSIGYPIANRQIYILDESLQMLPVMSEGEIFIGGAGLARGYLNQPALTAEKFIDHPFIPGQKIYRTGDLARWMTDGRIEFLGRKDHQIKLRGYRIELEEIENVLQLMAGVEKVIVVASKGEAKQPTGLHAFYKGEQHLTDTDLYEYAMEQLPGYMVPGKFVAIDEIPLTPNGKIDRKNLYQQISSLQDAPRKMILPENEIEHFLLNTWSQLLKLSEYQISTTDNFFELGGDSIALMRLKHAVENQYELTVEFKELLKWPALTIKQLSSFLESIDWITEGAQRISNHDNEVIEL